MTDTAQNQAYEKRTVDQLDLLWGCKAIAAFIGRTPRQTFEAVSKGELPARQVNRRWVASKQALREFFEGGAS